MGMEGHLVALAYSVVAVGPVLWAAAGRQGDGALSQRAFRDSAVRLPLLPAMTSEVASSDCLRIRGHTMDLKGKEPSPGLAKRGSI